jgi:O-antigen ligase
MTLRAHGLLAAAFGGALLAAVAVTYVAYAVGPAVAVALPVAAVFGVAVLRNPLVGVCAGVLTVPLEAYGVSAGEAGGFSVAELCLVATAGAASLRLVFDGDARPVHPAHRAFGALLVVIAVGLATAADPAPVVKLGLMWTMFLVVSIWVAGRDRREIETILLSIAVAGGLVGLLAVGGTGDQELQQGGAIATGRAQASFEQPNLLGFFLALTIPPAIVLSARGGALRRGLLLACAAAAGAGLMLSLSRTSILGTALALAILLAWPPFRRAALVGLAALALFTMFNLNALQESTQLQVVGERLGTLRDRGAVQDDGRWQMYTTTPSIIGDHPLVGVGKGNYGVASTDYGIRDPDGLPFDHAHNVPLTIAAELGLLGLVAFLAFLAFLAAAARRALRERGHPTWTLALALTAALATTLATGMGDYPLRANVITATLLIEAGLLIACARVIAADARRPAG